MKGGHRLVVFTSNLSYTVRKGIVEIDRALDGVEWLVLVHAPRKSIPQLIRSQWLNLNRHGWRWIPYQAADLFHRVTHRDRSTGPSVAGRPGDGYTAAALTAMAHVRIQKVDDIHAEATLQQVREFQADLGVSLAAPILRRGLFALPRLGTINLHKGRLPNYRGMPPAFWELVHDEREVGCTVHWVEEKLDRGAVLETATVARQAYSTLRGLQLELDEVGVELTTRAVAAVLGGTATTTPQAGEGRTFRRPTLKQEAELRSRMASRQPRVVSWPRRWAREAFSILAFRAWQMGLRHLVSPRITVLLYHRVSDDARDNLTVGIEQFDRQMALVARHCETLSLAQALAGGPIPRSAKPLVAVTFDDGYLDNFSHAAPILQRHGLPAAFYVSTGIVNSDSPFPHDVTRGNRGLPNMNWDQLRRMVAAGFEIGSHTVHHIDCAAEEEATVRAELAQSLADLRRELGLREVRFAYPYGGRRHMTPQRLELVKQAGFAGCLSAYGGTNVGTVDRFNILRRGISHEFSDRAFLRACLGLR